MRNTFTLAATIAVLAVFAGSGTVQAQDYYNGYVPFYSQPYQVPDYRYGAYGYLTPAPFAVGNVYQYSGNFSFMGDPQLYPQTYGGPYLYERATRGDRLNFNNFPPYDYSYSGNGNNGDYDYGYGWR
jgi:hypothetical protein